MAPKSRQLRLYSTASRAVAVIPEPISVRLAECGAMAWYLADADRRALVSKHQQRIAGGTLSETALRKATRSAFRSYGRYWAQALALPHRSTSYVNERIRIEGRHHVEECLAQGKGVIFAMPHVGYWDHGGAWVGVNWKETITAEALEPPDLFDWFCRMRLRHGMHVEAPGPKAMAKLGAALGRNEVVGLLCERDIVGNGEPLQFFGQSARVPLGPAVLSIRTGAPLLPNAVFEDGGLKAFGKILPPLHPVRTGGSLRDDAIALTNRLLACFESLIREHPEQWHVFQPYWDDERQPATIPSAATATATATAG